MPKFEDNLTISISMGGAAMQTPADVAELLERLALRLRGNGGEWPEDVALRDLNGNTVGTMWSVD
jgi:hypothetical protein